MQEALCRPSGTTLDIVHAEHGPPITQRTSSLAAGRLWHRLFDEPIRQGLGQCCIGELLLVAEDARDRPQDLAIPRWNDVLGTLTAPSVFAHTWRDLGESLAALRRAAKIAVAARTTW